MHMYRSMNGVLLLFLMSMSLAFASITAVTFIITIIVQNADDISFDANGVSGTRDISQQYYNR